MKRVVTLKRLALFLMVLFYILYKYYRNSQADIAIPTGWTARESNPYKVHIIRASPDRLGVPPSLTYKGQCVLLENKAAEVVFCYPTAIHRLGYRWFGSSSPLPSVSAGRVVRWVTYFVMYTYHGLISAACISAETNAICVALKKSNSKADIDSL
jgi:hypothetical protein